MKFFVFVMLVLTSVSSSFAIEYERPLNKQEDPHAGQSSGSMNPGNGVVAVKGKVREKGRQRINAEKEAVKIIFRASIHFSPALETQLSG